MGQPEPRLAEAAKMGFRRTILPKGTARRLEQRPLTLAPVETLSEALRAMF